MEEVLSKPSLYETITQKIVAMIEAGPGTYKAPWHAPCGSAQLPTNAATQAEYKGVNVLSLWIAAQSLGYPTALWASFRQWQQLGAHVRKGERGTLIVFYKRIEAKPFEAEDDDRMRRLRFVLKASHVFNRAQVDGYQDAEPPEPITEAQRISEIDAFVKAVNATVHHGYAVARYRHDVDVIEMPNAEWFIETPSGPAVHSYYAVLLHELTHWVGGPSRLNREFGSRFGDHAYAFEELVAELGAAFLCAAFGIGTEPRPDHATYVSSWLSVLKRDPKAIFAAASKAQEAFEHLAYLATR